MMTFSKLIEEVTVPALATLLGVDESHVRTMKARESIPPEYWGLIIESAPQQLDLTYSKLRAMRRERFASSEHGRAA